MEETTQTTSADNQSTTAVDTETIQDTTVSDPVKEALDKVKKNTTPRSELDKAYFSLESTKKRIKELGGVLKTDDEPSEDDNKPITRAELRSMEVERAQTTAISMAEDISDANERELTKYHLENSIRPSGNPAQDLANARAIVNSVKNSHIVQEVMRGNQTKPSIGSGSGAPARQEAAFQPTQEEATFMQKWGLTKEQIIAARKKEQGE